MTALLTIVETFIARKKKKYFICRSALSMMTNFFFNILDQNSVFILLVYNCILPFTFLLSNMDDDDSIDLSDTDEFMLDIEINPANVQDVINMALADDDSNSNLPTTITTTTDLAPISDELLNFDGNKFGE